MLDEPVSRFDVFLVNLQVAERVAHGSQRRSLPMGRTAILAPAEKPTVGSEIQKTRPCLVVSPDEMNRHIATVIVAPMTTQGRSYPSRIPCRFQGKDGWVVLDQLRTVDKGRLVRRLGRLGAPARRAVLATLAEIFAE